MAMVIARTTSGPLSSLLKQFDTAVGKHKDADLRSFAVFLTDDSDATEAQLKELADRAKISPNVPLAIVEDVAGPPAYKISKDAEVTVLLYTNNEIVKNFAFRAGELKESDVKTIVASIPKILPDPDEHASKEAELRKKAEELRRKLEEAAKKRSEK